MIGAWHFDNLINLWSAGMLRACWQGALLAAVVWSVCRLVPRIPASTRCALWWLTCAKLLVGLVWTAPLTLAVLPQASVDANRRAPTSSKAAQTVSATTGDGSVTAGASAIPSIRLATASSPFSQQGSVEAVLFGTWLVGVLLCMIVLTRQNLRVQRLLRPSASHLQIEDRSEFPTETLSAPGDVSDLAGRLARRMGFRSTPRVVISNTAPGPLVVGPWRAAIVLPQADVDRLTPAEMRVVVAHEMAHLRRRDLWFGIVPVLARIVFFFNPIVWLACREYELAQEAACDAEALRVTETPADAYGRLLLKLGATQSQTYRATAMGVRADFRLLLRRLQSLETPSDTNRRRAGIAMAMLIGFVAISLVPVRVTAQRNDKDARSKARIDARDARPLASDRSKAQSDVLGEHPNGSPAGNPDARHSGADTHPSHSSWDAKPSGADASAAQQDFAAKHPDAPGPSRDLRSTARQDSIAQHPDTAHPSWNSDARPSNIDGLPQSSSDASPSQDLSAQARQDFLARHPNATWRSWSSDARPSYIDGRPQPSSDARPSQDLSPLALEDRKRAIDGQKPVSDFTKHSVDDQKSRRDADKLAWESQNLAQLDGELSGRSNPHLAGPPAASADSAAQH